MERSHAPVEDRLRPRRGLRSVATGQRVLEAIEAAQVNVICLGTIRVPMAARVNSEPALLAFVARMELPVGGPGEAEHFARKACEATGGGEIEYLDAVLARRRAAERHWQDWMDEYP